MKNAPDLDATPDEVYKRELSQCERAWRNDSVVALTDAIILCHKGQLPMPLWLAQGTITLIKRLFEGKTLQQRGRLGKATTRHRNDMLHYERWDAVRELEGRQDEIVGHIKRLSLSERNQRPSFVQLEINYTLEQRCEAVAELFTEMNHPARGSAVTILRSYKLVNRNMNRGNISRYHIPSYDNPLRQP
jgi:hypothetical protein